MAENKNSFILYTDQYGIIKKLVERDRIDGTNNSGELMLMIFEYVSDLNPVAPNFIVEMAFEPIKCSLKRDLKKWGVKNNIRVESGRNGGIKSGIIRRLSKKQLYILRVYDEKEEFIKIGVTDESIGRRYSSSGDNKTATIPYLFDIVFQFFPEQNENTHIDLETNINEEFYDNKYVPLKKFGGYSECYKIESLEDIKSFILLKQNEPKTSSASISNQNQPNEAVSVSVNVSVNENVIEEKYPFEMFWDLYDKKRSKLKSEKKWNELSEIDKEKIMVHIPKYKIEQPNKKFRKDPLTYFNNQSWNDEVITENLTKNNGFDGIRDHYNNLLRELFELVKTKRLYDRNEGESKIKIRSMLGWLVDTCKKYPAFIEKEQLTKEQFILLYDESLQLKHSGLIWDYTEKIYEDALLKYYPSVYKCLSVELQTREINQV